MYVLCLCSWYIFYGFLLQLRYIYQYIYISYIISNRMIRKLLTNKIGYSFRTMTPEDYLYNQRDAMLAKKPHIKQLKPLVNANQGQVFISDQIQLVGVPKGQARTRFETHKDMDAFQQLLLEWQRDLVFLQIDPSAYIARQRFMSHKCAMGKVQDYLLDGVHLIDPHKALTWEETVVNLLSMDMLRDNSLPSQVSYKTGFYSYSYPYIQQKQQSTAITENFIQEISKQILDGKRSQSNLIDKVLYAGLMGKHKIMLGGMPETQYRMVLGKGVTVQEMRDMFKLVILKNKQFTIPMKIKDATQRFLPHIFLLPKDLYMTAMMKQAFQASMQMISLVNIQHWRPIQQYWIGPPHGISLSQATRIPEGLPGQTAQDLIEKQAILDVMLQSRVWSRNYLSNPFPYLFEDITKIDKKQLQNYKKLFAKHYKKYSQFKNRQIKQLSQQKVEKLTLEDQSKKTEEQFNKIQLDLKDAPTLSHLRQKMTLKRQKNIKIKAQ